MPSPNRRLLVATAVVLSALALPTSALGAAGDPDPSFDGDGQLTTAFGTTPFHPADSGNGAARLSTGEVYVAGTSEEEFALVRFTAAGALDTTFGGGDGIVITDISGSGSQDDGRAVSVDTVTGNVVVAGTIDNGTDEGDFAVVRYTSSGALDSGFGGGDGIVTTDFAGGDADNASAVALLASGNVIVGGSTEDGLGDNDFALASYTSAGVLDPAFDGDGGNGNGKVITDLGSNDDIISAVRITTGPKILVAGTTDPAGVDTGDFALARYNASTGVLDGTFDTDGKQTVSFSNVAGNGDGANALTTDTSDRILVAGQAGPGNGDFAVARLDGTTGAPDNTFDTDGKQTVTSPGAPPTLNSQDICNAVAVQADGKIVLAGMEGSAEHWMLTRLSDTGVVDSGFGTSGIVLTDFPLGVNFSAMATAVFVTATNIVAAGTGHENFAVARYAIADGALDATYGIGGKAEADVPHAVPSSETATGVALQSDGKLVVAGPSDVGAITQVGGDQQFALARYNPDGTLDAGFGAGGIDGNGRVSTNFDLNPDGSGTADSPNGVALQSDGKIVVAGSTDPVGADAGDILVARYTSAGNLDATFGGGDGLVTTDFGGPDGDTANAVAIIGTPGNPGFRIVVAGSTRDSNLAEDFVLAAYDTAGAPDSTFGSGTGKVVTDFGGGIDVARAVAIQADGRVVAAGSRSFTTSDFAVARYETDGDLDPTFSGGTVFTDFNSGFDQANGVAVRELGGGQVRILLAGRSTVSSVAMAGLAAYATDGSLDPTFGPGGADGNGKASYAVQAQNSGDTLLAAAFQPDGKIVASGRIEDAGFGLARTGPDGTLDASFGGDGLISTSFGPGPQFAGRGLTLQPDGRMVAAGGDLFAQGGSDFFVARYLADPTATPPAASPPAGALTTPTTPATTRKKKCKKKKRGAAAAKKCKKKKR